MIAIVAGALANKPYNGGAAWTRLSWVQGLQQLGFDVWFVEEKDLGPEEAGDASVAFFDNVVPPRFPHACSHGPLVWCSSTRSQRAACSWPPHAKQLAGGGQTGAVYDSNSDERRVYVHVSTDTGDLVGAATLMRHRGVDKGGSARPAGARPRWPTPRGSGRRWPA